MAALKIHRIIFLLFLKPLFLRISLCCLIFSALLEVLGLLEEASVILSRNLGFYGIFKYIILHFPALATEIMPLSVMIGSLFTLLQMTLSSEMSAMRATGLSTFHMYKHILPVPVFIGFLTMIVQFWVVPPCEQELNRWWNVTASHVNDQHSLPSLWFRTGQNIAHIGQISEGGHHLKDVTIYQRHAETGLLEQTQFFPLLKATPSGWEAEDHPIETTIKHDDNEGKIDQFTGHISLNATPRHIINMTLKGTFYTPTQIWKSLHGIIPSSLPPSNYMMTLFSSLFLPFQMAVMVLITLPVTYIPPRAGLRNPLPVYVMASGLGIVILQGMISALGNAGSLPILLAVSSGHVVAALLSLAWVLRMEEK